MKPSDSTEGFFLCHRRRRLRPEAPPDFEIVNRGVDTERRLERIGAAFERLRRRAD
jgi:hypothetical protein